MVAPQYSGVQTSVDDPSAENLPLVALDEIRAAAATLRGVAVRTPLLPFPPAGPGAWLKPESLQPIGAFKIRGAYVAIAGLSPEARRRGVITHSSGNHAQAVARAARLFGIPAVVVMPENAPAVKVERTRADGAEIVLCGPAGDERIAVARRLAEERGLTLVPPYDDRAVVAGQGTVGLEIVEDLAARGERGEPGSLAPTVFVPIGGGGLAAGVATAVKTLRPDARVFGVEPELAADARDSLREDRIVRWPAELTGRTIADGQRVQAVGRIPFAHLRRYLDGVVTVTEEAIVEAMRVAAREARLVVEPSGATAIAALLESAGEAGESGEAAVPRVAVVSGGNVDPAFFARILAGGTT